MFILTVQWDVRSLWSAASLSAKLYVICLFMVAVYTIIQITRAAFYLRTLRQREIQPAQSIRQTLASKMLHLRQLHFFFLLIFGACFASEFFGIIRAIHYSAASLSAVRMEIFEPAAAFAFVVFVALGFLHALQWFVTSRVDWAIR